MPTSSAISAATPSTPRRCRSSTNWACSSGSCSGRTTGSTVRRSDYNGRTLAIGDLSHLQHARAVHRDDAAVGLPRFPARGGARCSRASRLRMEAEVTGTDRGRRALHRRAAARTGENCARGKLVLMLRRARFARSARNSAGRSRSACRSTCSGSPCPRPRPGTAAARGDQRLPPVRADRPGRLLAMRRGHRQGRGGGDQGARDRGFPRGRVSSLARLEDIDAALPGLGCGQAAVGLARPADRMVAAPACWRSATRRTR